MLALFLRGVEITGFKSFARSTRLVLPSGITALVGPNGSGKSNVVDAIRWCLGEQSMRDLRGQRAEDVIYAGPRRSGGMAEVILTFEAGPADAAAAPEFSVGRRLYRSGESEYLVNGRKVRLRDVQDGLRAIGVDSSRSVVVNQGMADALLAATPMERRALLEHAAGLSAYRARRDEARQKLGTTVQNVQTIEAVLAELEPRLRILRRQARAVREREEAQSRLDVRLREWYGSRWETLRARIAALEVAFSDAERERRMAETELRGAEEAAHHAVQRERAWRGELASAREALHSAQRARDELRFGLKEVQQRIATLEDAVRASRSRGALGQASADEVRPRLDEAQSAVVMLSSRRTEHTTKREDLERDMAQLLPLLRQQEKRLSDALRSRRQLLEERDRLEGVMATEQRVLDGGESRVKELTRLLKEETSRVQRLEKELSAARDTMSRAEDLARTKRTELQTEAERLTHLQTYLDRLDRLRSRLRRAIAEWERRRAASASAVAGLQSHAGAAIIDAQIPTGWERAVAAALGPGSGWSPSDGEAPRWTALHWQSFEEWRRHVAEVLSGTAAWGDEVVLGLPEGLVTPLAATLFTGSEAEAETVWNAVRGLPAHLIGSPAVQIVARDGFVRTAAGRQYARQDERLLRFLEIRRELGRLERRLSAWSGRAESILRSQDETSAAAESARGRVLAVEGEYGAATRELAEAQGSIHALNRAASIAEAEISRRRAELAHLEDAMASARSSLQDADGERQQVVERLRIAASEHDEAARVETGIRSRIERLKGEIDDLVRQVDVVVAQIEAQSRLAASLGAQMERANEEYHRALQEAAELEEQLTDWRAELGACQSAYDRAAGILEEHTTRVHAIEAAEPGMGATPELADLRARASRAVAAHERLTAHRGQVKGELEALQAEIEVELRIAPAELPDAVVSVPTDEEIRRLRRAATQYADVDDSVIAEFDELQTRYTTLGGHLEDLNDAIRGLQDIISVADRKMEARFGEAFVRVNREFSRTFEMMLRGGEAVLEEMDEDGGIGIRARLPGRRARSSSAFSGGERTLVAASLLFGLLRIRPTPFVVLDEVDAALDESNVDRYLAALRDIARNTQCIVVTHNRATMAAADALYGMTMDEEGTSSLLSLRLDAYGAAV